jgi:glycosyltransferase involved in cell wall biosynthesis
MRIIFLNRYFHPDHSATSQMLSDLAFALARSGVDVHVVASRQRYDNARAALPALECIDEVAIHRVPSSRFGRDGLAGRALDYLTFYAFAAWRLWRLARKGDIVVAKTDPPLVSIVAAPIAAARGARFVNWVQDLFPEVAQAAGVIGAPGRLFLPLLRRLRNRALRAAETNVVLGECMAEQLRNQGIPHHKVSVIANWQDGALVRPVAHGDNPLRRAWGLEGEFVVGYSGNLGRVHEFATVLDAMALLQGRTVAVRAGGSGVRVRFLFIGGGAQQRVLRDEIAARGLRDVALRPYQPRNELSQSLSAADVHLVTLRPEFEGMLVPSKFYGIAAAGRPAIFIGDPNGEMARVIARAGCGGSVRQGDGAGLAEAILKLAGDPAICAEMAAAARRIFDAEYDKPIAVARWQSLLAKIGPQA